VIIPALALFAPEKIAYPASDYRGTLIGPQKPSAKSEVGIDL
jgi:hypothetical protein